MKINVRETMLASSSDKHTDLVDMGILTIATTPLSAVAFPENKCLSGPGMKARDVTSATSRCYMNVSTTLNLQKVSGSTNIQASSRTEVICKIESVKCCVVPLSPTQAHPLCTSHVMKILHRWRRNSRHH